MIAESVDSFTDYVLNCRINSDGHNKTLLRKGKWACVSMYTHTKPGNEHSTVSAFSVNLNR